MNMQQDESFQMLLSSQRQLLCQLNRESAMQKAAKNNVANSHEARFAGTTRPYLGNGCTLQTNEQPYHNNSLDSFTDARRLSMSHNFDSCNQMLLPPFSMAENCGFGLMDCSMRSSAYPSYEDDSKNYKVMPGKDQFLSEKYRECVDAHLEQPRKKRRLSSLGLGFMSPLVLSENNGNTNAIKNSTGRGESSLVGLASVDESKPNQGPGFEYGMEPNKEDCRADGGSDGELSEQFRTRDMRSSDRVRIAKAMENFTRAMEKSQKSQQDIHDWDRKMGLKRSHSKTMRLSSRSRKQLALVLRRDMESKALPAN